MKNNVNDLLNTNSLKLKCTEDISKLFCRGCGTILRESELLDKSCPMCNESSFKWQCDRCNGDFDEPSLGGEHPCRSVQIFESTGKITFEAEKSEFDLGKIMALIKSEPAPPAINTDDMAYPKSSVLPIWEDAVIDIIKPKIKTLETPHSEKLPTIRYLIYTLASYALLRYFVFPEIDSDMFTFRLIYQGIPILLLISFYIWIYGKYRIAEYYQSIDNLIKKKGSAFELKKNALMNLYWEHNGLPQTENLNIDKLYEKAKNEQLLQHLSKCTIQHSTISGIGKERKEVLIMNGIRSALDVDRNKILRIHGFGNAIADDLMDWQSTCKRKFKFNPNTIELENAKKDIKNKLVVRKKNIENDLLNGVNSLKKAREETILGRESLIKELEVIFKQLAQAEGHIFIGKNIKLKVLTFLAMVGVILALITIQ